MALTAVVRVPAVYMSSEADESQRQFFQFIKEKADRIQTGYDVVVILPSSTDPETGKYLFDIEIKGV